jgi:class 3 adenylate cyclase
MKMLSERATKLASRAGMMGMDAARLPEVAPLVNRERSITTLMFVDVVASTEMVAEIGDQRWRDVLKSYHELVRRELTLLEGHETSNAGDGFLVIFDRPAQAIRAACAIRDGVRSLGLEVRAGVHTGECEWVAGNPVGIAVHIGARIGSSAAAGEVLASGTVRDLVRGARIKFAQAGAKALRGVPGQWEIFRVEALE